MSKPGKVSVGCVCHQTVLLIIETAAQVDAQLQHTPA